MITVPFLICHGENDRQIPVSYAHRSYEQAVNSPNRRLRLFTAEEGATEHIGLDHLSHTSTYIADWVADTLGHQPRVPRPASCAPGGELLGAEHLEQGELLLVSGPRGGGEDEQ